ncbi:MAG: terpene cyclase/mutase family protein [Ruminococcus sp.]|nr:terpene cyclase/mutase family protein [Ruminococcus sp.]
MKAFRKLSVIYLLLTLISISFINVFAASYTTNDIDKRIDSILNYEYNYTNTNSINSFVENYLAPNAGTGECDWFAISLSRNGTSFNANSYINSLNKVISDIYNSGVKNTKITDLQRIGLAYVACNKDISNILGKNLLADCTYNRELSELSAQGIMTLDYALILLDSKNYSVPQNALTTRDNIVSKILSLQLDNGGFALTGTAPDADVTAMTVTALAPYIKSNKTVSDAVDKALNRLSKMQKDDGSFASYGKLNCESTAQVIVMLTSLGIDPESDERFIKNGNSVLDAMLTYQTAKGGFKHLQNGNENQMAAYQAFNALVAYKSFILTSQGLYNFSDKINSQQTVTEPKTNPSNNKNSSSSKIQKSNNNINSKNSSDRYNNGNNNYNNNSSPSSVYAENAESENNQNNVSEQNSSNEQNIQAESNNVQIDTSSQHQETAPTAKSAENIAVNTTATLDEVKKISLTSHINNFEEIKEYNNIYVAENLSCTGIAVFILILGYVGLYIYFIKKYRTPNTDSSEKGE